jgi:hypothetical protein
MQMANQDTESGTLTPRLLMNLRAKLSKAKPNVKCEGLAKRAGQSCKSKTLEEGLTTKKGPTDSSWSF